MSLNKILGADADLLVSAAWLHDIGYAETLAVTGFHPLDGARHLRDSGFGDRRLWTLVANHTCAYIEAGLRGLGSDLAAEFPAGDVDPFLISAVTYCDVTSGPDGRPVDVDARIDEILSRYGPEDVVHRAISQAAPTLRQQASEIATTLAEAQNDQT